MGNRRFSRIASALTLAAFLIQSTGCVEKTIVVPTAQAQSPPPPSIPKKPESPSPILKASVVDKLKWKKPFLISDIWFGKSVAPTSENQASFADSQGYRADREAAFKDLLDDSIKPKKLTGFDHFLHETAGWAQYLLAGAALAGWIGTHLK